MTAVPDDRAGALAGVTVLDLTRNLAGPFCTMILADLGAQVVKVESPGRGDDTREWWPPAWHGESATFLSANRNKRSIAVDLDTPGGSAVVRQLAERADVLVESFKPGSLVKRGLGYEDVVGANPRIVYCSVSAYGETGPMAGKPGYDPIIQAYSGIMSLVGEPDSPPARLPIGAIDLGTGLWSTIAIQAALAERDRTGRGARIEGSLFETAVWWLSYHVVGYLASGVNPGRAGTATPFLAPYEAFETGNGVLMVCAANDGLFAALCGVLGEPGLPADPRFATNSERVVHRHELHALLAARFADRPAVEWERLLGERSVPCSSVRSVADVVADEQTAVLGLLQPVAGHPEIPDLRLVDMPIRTDGRRAQRADPPPLLGQHTDAVLAELGYDEAEREALRKNGVVG
jgi:crotonobetainyl-CoA:carnitine CoA-transferase CaiB-like acyl-CoA transferase